MKNEFDYLNDVRVDFSQYENIELTEQESIDMKKQLQEKTHKRLSWKKCAVIAACVAAIAITGTAFASGYVSDIIKTFTTGHNEFIQTDSTIPQELPNELKGKLFDKNGVAYETMSTKEFGEIYDENGEKIGEEELKKIFEEALGGKVKVEYEGDKSLDDSTYIYETIDKAQENANFDIKVPEYIPEEFELSKVYSFKNEDGTPSGDYVNLVYSNKKGKEISMFERVINEQTSFETSTDGKIEEIMVNGYTAVLMDEQNIDWETDDSVSVGISSKGNITKNELIKMAESVK